MTSTGPIPAGRVFATPAARRLARQRGLDLAALARPGRRIFAADVLAHPVAAPAASAPAPAASAAGRLIATPAARRLARERGLELARVQGTGPGRRIVAADVLAAPATAAGAAPEGLPAAELAVPFDRMRRVIAERLTQSVRTIPQFTVSADLDCTRAQAWRAAANAGRPRDERLSIGDLLAVAVARALVAFPRLNSHVADDRIVIKPAVNLGLAVATSAGGLLVPVLAGVERMGVEDVARGTRALVAAARAGRMASGAAATCTISNLGGLGVSRFTAIISPPECAILAVGAAVDRVVAIRGDDGQAAIAVRSMMTVTLTCDHRAVDGAYAAGFLARLSQLFQDPATFGGEGVDKTAAIALSAPSGPRPG
jgi:pyruvate dehydrogenase E2 component (dihydrolipoamide acetyltransferase)